MIIGIITSSYPAHPDDAKGTAGLFVRDFARSLVKRGHSVVVLTAARSISYTAEEGVTVVPIPWQGGEGELASISFSSPRMWKVIAHFFIDGCKVTSETASHYSIDRFLCMWVVPSGIFGWWAKQRTGVQYDTWALGSDIWKIQKIPFGKSVLRFIMRRAEKNYADGPALAIQAARIGSCACTFMPSSRTLPPPVPGSVGTDSRMNFLFVGRYHPNKGPDLLLEAIHLLSPEVRKLARLDLYGYGMLREKLEIQISQYTLEDTVSLHETIDAQTLADRLQFTDYLVIPSRIESIPVVLSDALQSGVPVLVADVGDMGILVRDHGAGMVFQPNDPAAIANAISSAVSVNSADFSNGVRALANQFDIERVAGTWLSTFADAPERDYQREAVRAMRDQPR